MSASSECSGQGLAGLRCGVFLIVLGAFGLSRTATLAADEPGTTPEANRIRASAPPLESPLFVSIRDNQLRTLSPTWSELSADVDAPGSVAEKEWTGKVGYETPIFLDGLTVAIFEARMESEPALWQLDLDDFTVRCLANLDKPQAGDREFDELVWHEVNGDVLAEFVRIRVGRRRATSFEGESVLIEVNLRTGQVQEKKDSAREQRSKENLRKLLLDKRRPAATQITPQPADESLRKLTEVLASKGVAFDQRRARFTISEGQLRQLAQGVERLTLTDNDAADKVSELSRVVQGLPTAPALRDLDWQLRLASAVIRDDTHELDQLAAGAGIQHDVAAERRTALRNLAAYQRLRLVAKQGDAIQEYDAFTRQCDDAIAAKDAAILRMHEIGFHAACQMATVDAFDEFARWAPKSLQFDKATEYAEALERERIDSAVAKSRDPDGERERIGTGLYVDWRKSAREGHLVKAQRCFGLLGEHPELQRTKAAADAQDTRDEEDFRKTVIRQNDEHTGVLRKVASVQQRQLDVMGQQLAEQKATNVQLNQIRVLESAQLTEQQNMNSQLDSVNGQLSYIGAATAVTAKAAGDAARASRESADTLRDLRRRLD